MDNQDHLYRLSQPLLDAHHKGMPARDAARELGSQLFNSCTTGLDVMVMMFDDVTRAGFGKHEKLGAMDIPVEPMIVELVHRLYSRWQAMQLCPCATETFMAAQDFIDFRSRMIDAYRAHRGVITLKTLNISAMQCLDASDSLYQRAVYLSRARDNIRRLASSRLIRLFYPGEALEMDGTRPLVQAQERALASYQDRELGTRIMHSLRKNRLATYDPTYPIDGARSIYVLIPLLISYLTHPSNEMERRMPEQLADLNASLTELGLQMDSVNKRYERLRARAMEP